MPAEDDGAVTGLDTASIINATAALAALVDGPGAGADRRTRAGAAAAAGLVAEVPAWPLTPPPGAASSLAWITCTRPSRVPADEAAPVLVWRPALTRQEEEEEEGGEGEPALPVLVALPSGPAAPFAASAAAVAPPAGTGSGGTLVAVSGPFLGALATAGGGGAACVFGRKSAGTSLPLHPSGDGGGSWDAACEAPPWDLRSSPGGRPAMAVRVRLALTAPGGCAAPVVVATDATDPPLPPQKQKPPSFAFTYVPDPAPSAVAPAALARDNAAAGVDLSVFLDRRPAPWGAATPKEGGKAAAELPTPSSDAEAEAAMASAFPSPLIRLVGAGDREADVDLAAAWSAGGRALVARLPPSLSLRTGRSAVALSLDGQRFAGGEDGSVAVDVGGPDVTPSPSLVVLGEGDAAATAWTAAFDLAGPASAALPPGGAAAAVSAALYGWPGPGPAPAVHVTPPTLTWGGGESAGRAPPGPRRAAVVAVSLAGGAPLCRTCVVLVTAAPGRGLPPPLPGTPPAQVALAGPGLSRAAFRRVARLVSPPLTLSRPPPPPGGREQPPSTPPPALKVELAGPPSLAPLLPITLAFDLIPRAGDAAPFFGGAAVRAGGAVRWFATLDPPPPPAPLAGNNSTLLLVSLPLPPIDWAAVPPSAGAALDVRLVRSWAVRPLADGGGAGGAGPHLTLSGVRPGECPPGWAAAGAGQAAAAVEADDASFDGSAARPVEAGGGGGGGPTPSPAAEAAGLRVLALQAAPPGAAVPLPITLSGTDDAAGAGNGAPLSPSAGLEVGATVPAGVGTAVLCLAPAAPGATVEVVDDERSPLVPGPPGEDGGPPSVPAAAAAGLAAVVAATTGSGPGGADARVSGRRRLAASPPAAAWCEGVGGTPWTLPLAPGQNEFGVVVTPAGAPRAWRPAGLAAAAHAAAARGLGGWGWVAGRSSSPSSDAATTTPPPPPTLWLTVVRLAEEGHARLAELAAAAVVPGSNGSAAAATAQPQPRLGAPSPLPHTLLLCSDTDPTARACSPAEPLLLTLPAGAESVRLVPRLAARGVAGVTLEVGGRVVGDRDQEGRQPPEAGLVGVRSLRPGQRAHVPIVVTAEDGVTAAVYALALEREEEAGWGGNGTTLGAAGAWSSTAATPALTPTTTTPARCARCPAGRAAPAVDSPSCGLCPPGTAAAGPAAPACSPCPPGHFSRGWGADRCAPCVPGSHAPAPGARLCVPCPPNTTALAPGAARCADPARRTVDPDATPALLISFELVLTGAPALSDLPRRVGVDGTPAAVLGRLVAADTAAALRCGPGDVSVSPVVARARRVLAVNVTAALAQVPAAGGAVPPAPAPPGPAPGPEALEEEEDPASAAAALASLSADVPMALLASDPDAFFGRTTAALGAHAAPSAERPPTAVASVPPAVGAAALRRRLGIGAGCLVGAAAVSGCAWAAAVAARQARRARRGRRATTSGTESLPAAPPRPPSSSPPVSARRLLVGGPASDE